MPKKNGQPTKAELRMIMMQEKLNNDDFVIENKLLLNWRLIATKFKVSDNVLIQCKECIQWPTLCKNQKLSLNILKLFYKKITPYWIINSKQELDLELLQMITPYFDNSIWRTLSFSYTLPFNIIQLYKDKLNLEMLKIEHLIEEERNIVESWVVMKKLQS